jgi:YfiH family protein
LNLSFIDYQFGVRASTPPAGVVLVHQIHSARVLTSAEAAVRLQDADALISNTPGIPIGIKTADCVPVLLADPVHRAVAAVHAGWRGTVASIVSAAIRRMSREFGVRAEDLHAAIGPSIGSCCYEVGPEVAAEFGIRTDHHVHLDLWQINRKQLEAAGLDPANISVSGECTCCGRERYHSYRRDREAAGRMVSWIRIAEPENISAQ